MTGKKAEVLLLGPPKPTIIEGLAAAFTLHVAAHATDPETLIAEIAPRLRAIAVSGPPGRVDGALMERCPALEIVSSFGVGYDNIDAASAAAQGIVVTNTPDVLTEEVADTAIGLLLCTVRQLPQADRYVRAGHWPKAEFPYSQSLRNRKVGIVGLGRIGRAIARRLEAMGVEIAYHSRRPVPDVAYRYAERLIDLARDTDVLIVITPGGDSTRNLIDARILEALGPNGILINLARGSVVDEKALIAALRNGTILSAGLDVFAQEPHVPAELIAMDHVVLLPHVGSASVHTRRAMEQLVVDNIVAWAEGKPPLTPVPETPWPPKKR